MDNYCSHRFKEGCSCGQVVACKDCGHTGVEGHHQDGCSGEKDLNDWPEYEETDRESPWGVHYYG